MDLSELQSPGSMKLRALDFLVCPRCHESLSIETRSVQGAEVLEGILGCLACNRSYPIARGVPRFVGDGAYASSFGRQWNWFRTVQLDSSNGSVQSEEALRAKETLERLQRPPEGEFTDFLKRLGESPAKPKE